MKNALLGVLVAVLLGVTGWCLVRGIVIAPTTAGLLTAPVDQVTLRGAWLVGATVAGTAAILLAIQLVARLRRRPGPPPSTATSEGPARRSAEPAERDEHSHS